MHFHTRPIYRATAHNQDALKSWREHEGSLTDKLLAARGSVELALIGQHWVHPGWWERYFIQMNDDLLFLREIVMGSGGVSYWYARTVIGQSCYNLDPTFFNRLEHESIRNLIFGEERVQRVNLICYPIDEQCIEFSWVKQYLKPLHQPLWLRLAEYSFKNTGTFYLAELLFPELEGLP